MSKKILISGLFHETHSFVEDYTSQDDFQILVGDEILTCTGNASPLGGVLEYAGNMGWKIHPTLDMRATPSGTVYDDVLHRWWTEFEMRWNPDCDAIFLVLHGAMVCESFLDVEGEALKRIHSLTGAAEKPVFGVYDLHANFTPSMARYADCLVAYRENPHADAREAAVRSAKLLTRHFETGERPKMQLRQLPIIWPPTGTGTSNDPMKSLMAKARELEDDDDGIWALNINAGFGFADTPNTGVSLQSVATKDTFEELNELSGIALDLKDDGTPMDMPLEKVVVELQMPVDGLTVLVEPSDNIGGGAPGDCTDCIRAFVRHQTENAAICLNDPKSVRALSKCVAGETRTLPLGGKGSRLDRGPLELEVTLLSLSDGQFELENRQSHLASIYGNTFDMGPCAVVRHAGITILLTSNKTPPFDLSQWRSQGIEPANLNVIVVKAAVAHRAAYDPITTRSFTVDTSGPCRSNLKRLPFKHAKL